MLSELERRAFTRQKVQRISKIELKPVVMLDAKDEPLAQEFLQAKGDKGQYTVLEDVASWLEKHKRFQDAITLWERAKLLAGAARKGQELTRLAPLLPTRM